MIGVIVITGNIYVGYSLSLLIPQKLGLQNIYINGIFLGISEIIGYFIVIPIASIVKRRQLNFWCSFAVVILNLVLLFLEFITEFMNPNFVHWLQTILSCLIKLAYCINYALIFNYCSELFATKIRGMTLGICIFFGRTMVIFAFYSQVITDHFTIHPMIGTIFTALLALPVCLHMPETINSGISN